MPKSLKDFFLKFVSVVDKGDNPEAKILIMKEKPIEKEAIKETEGGNVMTKTFDEIVKSLPEEEQTVVNAEIEKALIKPASVSQVEWDAADFPGKIKLINDAKNQSMGKGEEVIVEKETEDIVKSADPKIQEIITKQKEDLEKVQKDNEAKDGEIKKFQEDLKKEAIEKTVATFDRIAVPKEEMVGLFAKLDEESSKLVEKVMKSVNEQLVTANIVKVIGTDAEGEQLTAEATVEKEAKELMKSDTNLTKAQAIVKVYKSKPELYKQYQDEQK